MKKQQIAVLAKNVDLSLISCILNSFDIPLVVVTPNNDGLNLTNVEVIHDDRLLSRASFFQRCRHPRPGWLYQQFLKYQVVLSSDFENTLVIDGDSLIKDVKFLTPNSLYYTQKKIENFYNNFISKTLGMNYVVTNNYITNQMNFSRNALEAMLNTALGSSCNYPEFIMSFLEENLDSEFSEYQTYAAWLLQETGVEGNRIKVFRRHDLISVEPHDSLEKYDLIAFERHHKSGLLRSIRARLLYSLSKNLG